MKKYEDFGTVTTGTLSLNEKLTRELIKDLEPMLKGKQLLIEDRKLVGQAGVTRRYRKRTKLTAAGFAEGADIPTVTTFTISNVDVTPTPYGCRETITGQAIKASDVDIINEVKGAIADAMARFSDTFVWEKIMAKVDIANEAVGTSDGVIQWYQLANTKVILIGDALHPVTTGGVTRTLGVDYLVDFWEGWLYFVVAPTSGDAIVATYDYTARNGIEVVTEKVFTWDDAVDMQKTIIANNATPDAMVLNDQDSSLLMKDDKFTHATEGLGDKTILNGAVGKAVGCQVLVSQQAYEGIPVMVKKGSDLGYYVVKEPVTSKVVEIEAKADDVYVKAWENMGVGIIQSAVICAAFNSHQYAKKH